jgi:hypothetical protein
MKLQDRHKHATTAFPALNGGPDAVKFSTSPLNQFVPPSKGFAQGGKYKQIESTDIAIYHHRHGTSMFGAFAFDTSDEDTLTLEFKLIDDGHKVWNYTLHRTR